MITIREEKPPDFAQVFRVVTEAFEQDEEARLVERLRSIEGYVALVAEKDGLVVGHISFTPLTLDDEKTDFSGLAPMAVLPEYQNQGIGSRLVNEGLKAVADKGFNAVFVLGHSHYYPRFGFEVAKTKGFKCEYPSPDESFMVVELTPGVLEGKSGLIKYRPEFSENIEQE